jgi:hypothetical protein
MFSMKSWFCCGCIFMNVCRLPISMFFAFSFRLSLSRCGKTS